MSRKQLLIAVLAATLLAALLFVALRLRGSQAAGRSLEAQPGGPVLLVGIDGATFDRIDPLVAAGRLPTLGGLMKRGARGSLATLEPTVSPAIWTTVATGRLPAEHGILGFEGVPGQTMTTLPTTGMRQVRAFWNVLSEQGVSVGVIGWWVSWPAERVDGYVVSDRVAYTRMEATIGQEGHHPYEVFPEQIAEGVHALVRRPEQITTEEVRRFMSLSDAEIERLIQGAQYRHGDVLPEFKYVHQSDRSTADIAAHLLRTRPTDVTAVALYGVDTVSHLGWHFMEPREFPFEISQEGIEKLGGLIDNYYVFVDELLGEILAAAPHDANVIVFSDHGFGPTGMLPWSGGHGRITPGAPLAPDGILILSGPAFEPGVRLERPHVLDVTPTLLQLCGVPAAEDMPGHVLTAAFRKGSRPLPRVPTYETGPLPRVADELLADPQMDEALMEKLRGLGYVE